MSRLATRIAERARAARERREVSRALDTAPTQESRHELQVLLGR